MRNLLKSTQWLLTLLVIAGLLAPPVGVRAQQRMAPTTTFTVNDAGWDQDINPGDGVCETEGGVCSLQAAVNEANASEGADVIVFDPSIDEVYPSSLLMLNGEQGITIKGEGHVTLSCDPDTPLGPSVIYVKSDNNVIQGLTVDGGGYSGMSCVKIEGNGNLLGVNINEATNHHLEQNTFMNCSDNGVFISRGNQNQVTGNTIVNNGRCGVAIYHGDENIIGAYVGLFGYNYQVNYISGNGGRGISVSGGVGNYIAGNIIGSEDNKNFDSGVYIQGSESLNTTIFSNVIREHTAPGITIQAAQGTQIKANTIISNVTGVNIRDGATQTLIGSDGSGSAEYTRNVIAGNETGIRITGGATAQTVIAGNYIGTDATGTLTQSNTNGIVIEDASNNRIGGPTALERNLISGNVETGISIEGAASQNVIINNYIGTDVTGALALPNQRNGITLNGDNNRVGGATSAERNLISGNGEIGVAVGGDNNEIVGNYVGVDVTG
ncbi:MAG: right-handed parallel beta-helix repeat-containing protein, partial [Anaerolineae bacterium]|nr:right-handed parallel beta-helix repeat-containing protein [Anaerolineae bacterium]